MDATSEVVEEKEETSQEYLPKSAKQAYFLSLLGQGLSVREAAKRSHITEFHGYHVRKKVKETGLCRRKVRKMADEATEQFFKAFKDGNMKVAPQIANLISEIEARRNPVIRQNLNLNANVDVDPVDFSQLLNTYRKG